MNKNKLIASTLVFLLLTGPVQIPFIASQSTSSAELTLSALLTYGSVSGWEDYVGCIWLWFESEDLIATGVEENGAPGWISCPIQLDEVMGMWVGRTIGEAQVWMDAGVISGTISPSWTSLPIQLPNGLYVSHVTGELWGTCDPRGYWRSEEIEGEIHVTVSESVPDFTISISPTSGVVGQGGSKTLYVSVVPKEEYAYEVSLSTGHLPAGVTVAFSPSHGVPPFTSVAKIRVSHDAPTGSFWIHIRATGEGEEGKFKWIRTVSYNLKIVRPVATSFVERISPYWRSEIPFEITACSEGPAESVELWYRYSPDNTAWGEWKLFGIDDTAPWKWEFTAPDGDGFYEFYSIAVDEVGGREPPPANPDTSCGVDTIPPVSLTSTVSQTSVNPDQLPAILGVEVDVCDSAGGFPRSGIVTVELYCRYSQDLVNWSDWELFDNIKVAGGPSTVILNGGEYLAFEAPEYGYYQFYSIASDVAGNRENSAKKQQQADLGNPEAATHVWHDMIVITNKQKLIEFAKTTGESNPEEKVNELLRTTRQVHPEAKVILLDEEPEVEDPANPTMIDLFIQNFTGKNPNVKYLMILGPPQVVPFYIASDTTIEEDNISTDYFYAEIDGDWWPELAVGRVFGRNIETMINLLKRSIEPKITRTALVSCGDERCEDVWSSTIKYLQKNEFFVAQLPYNTYEWDVFPTMAKDKGLIVHYGHGNPHAFATHFDEEWILYDNTDLDIIGLGTTNPIVVSIGCHTALIEEGSFTFKEKISGKKHTVEVDNFAKTISAKFIEKGATAFMGPTRRSYPGNWFSGYAEELGKSFVKLLVQGRSIGEALCEAKQKYSPLLWTAMDSKTIYEYVLYGDPKFRPMFLAGDPDPFASVLEVRSDLDMLIEIPEFSHEKVGGYDVITIPRGCLSFNEGYPVIPYLAKRIRIEPNYTPEVIFLESSKEKLPYSINPPIAQTFSAAESIEVEQPLGETYPENIYKMRIFKLQDGSRILELLIIPLQYNPRTGEAWFYKMMRFRISTKPAFLDVTPSFFETVLGPEDRASWTLQLKNCGENTVSFSIEVKNSISQFIRVTEERGVLNPEKTTEISLSVFIPRTAPLGEYRGTIVIKSEWETIHIPVLIEVQAHIPAVRVEKIVRPSAKIEKDRKGALISRITITNVEEIGTETRKLKVIDEIPAGWELKNPESVTVSRSGHQLGQRVLKNMKVENNKLIAEIDFSKAPFETEEEITIIYPIHPVKIEPIIYELTLQVVAVSQTEGKTTIEKGVVLEIK